jgi:hypothetical protein
MFGFIAFVFLFTLLDTNNKSSILVIWAKSIFVYILFIMMTKSKWYFVVPVLVLLLIDQSLKKELAFQKQASKDVKSFEESQKKVSRVINIAIVILIVVGTIHYMFLQASQYQENFDMVKFFFTTSSKCKNVNPNSK